MIYLNDLSVTIPNKSGFYTHIFCAKEFQPKAHTDTGANDQETMDKESKRFSCAPYRKVSN